MAFEVFLDAGALGLLDEPFARRIGTRDTGFQTTEIEAEELPLPKTGEKQGGFAQRLRRQRPGIGRCPAQKHRFLDQGHLLAEVGHLGGPLFSGGPGTDDDQSYFFGWHENYVCFGVRRFSARLWRPESGAESPHSTTEGLYVGFAIF